MKGGIELGFFKSISVQVKFYFLLTLLIPFCGLYCYNFILQRNVILGKELSYTELLISRCFNVKQLFK